MLLTELKVLQKVILVKALMVFDGINYFGTVYSDCCFWIVVVFFWEQIVCRTLVSLLLLFDEKYDGGKPLQKIQNC